MNLDFDAHTQSIDNLFLVISKPELASKVLIELAKDNPEIFNELVNTVTGSMSISVLDKELREIADREGYAKAKIKLIKHYREKTGAILKDSKDYIENLFAKEEGERNRW